MNLALTLQLLVLLNGLGLVAYALNQPLGLSGTVFANLLQTVALSTGVALLGGLAQPYVRGVKAGDRVIAATSQGGATVGAPATALGDGRMGSRVRVRLPDGSMGEGVVVTYAGALMPATVRLTEIERQTSAQME